MAILLWMGTEHHQISFFTNWDICISDSVAEAVMCQGVSAKAAEHRKRTGNDLTWAGNVYHW